MACTCVSRSGDSGRHAEERLLAETILGDASLMKVDSMARAVLAKAVGMFRDWAALHAGSTSGDVPAI